MTRQLEVHVVLKDLGSSQVAEEYIDSIWASEKLAFGRASVVERRLGASVRVEAHEVFDDIGGSISVGAPSFLRGLRTRALSSRSSISRAVYLDSAEREALIWATKRALRGVEAPPPLLPTLTAALAVASLESALISLEAE